MRREDLEALTKQDLLELARKLGILGRSSLSKDGLVKAVLKVQSKERKPIFDKKCASCHSRRVKGGYSLVDYDKVMTSGDNAPVIAAGDAANSVLVQMLRGIETQAGGQMPPGRPLKTDQIELIERWINQGAQDN